MWDKFAWDVIRSGLWCQISFKLIPSKLDLAEASSKYQTLHVRYSIFSNSFSFNTKLRTISHTFDIFKIIFKNRQAELLLEATSKIEIFNYFKIVPFFPEK